MLLTLFSVADADNVIGKTMVEKLRMNINLKRDTDIINPILFLVPNIPEGFNGVNYAEIPELGRYYFIDSATSISNTVWQLNLSCDVLETYKHDILASNARFLRKVYNGDCAGQLDASICKTVSTHNSSKGLVDGTTMLITTVGAE